MQILQIVADGSPGGGTTHVLQVLRGLRGEFSMGLVTQRDSYLLNEARNIGVPVFEADFFRGRLDVRVPLRLRRIIRELKPRLVHAHGGRAAFFYSLMPQRPPYVYTVHSYHFRHKRSTVRRLALIAEYVASHRAAEAILVSRYDAQLAGSHGLLRDAGQSTVIHNGIPLSEVAAPQQEETLSHIGFIGRLEPQKDPLLFVEIMERLPEYTATMAGGGSMESKIRTELERRGLAERVRMLGSLTHLETLNLLPGLGAVVMTSRWEGLPILPLEAMWVGVPIVAPNVGGLGEIIEDGESGLLVSEHSADDFARAVARITENGEFRDRIVENGRRRVRESFSEERMLTEIKDVYQRVMEK